MYVLRGLPCLHKGVQFQAVSLSIAICNSVKLIVHNKSQIKTATTLFRYVRKADGVSINFQKHDTETIRGKLTLI